MKSKTLVYIGAAGDQVGNSRDIYYVFDPREDTIQSLKDKENVHFYPTGLYSSNTTVKLHLTKKGSCSSIYEPNLQLLEELIPRRIKDFTVKEIVDIEVKRLDSIIPAGTSIDFMKIDTQGSELDILKGAGDLLQGVKKLKVEVEFKELYKNQPLEKDVTEYLKGYGFELTSYARRVAWDKAGLIFADAIYINKNLKE